MKTTTTTGPMTFYGGGHWDGTTETVPEGIHGLSLAKSGGIDYYHLEDDGFMFLGHIPYGAEKPDWYTELPHSITGVIEYCPRCGF